VDVGNQALVLGEEAVGDVAGDTGAVVLHQVSPGVDMTVGARDGRARVGLEPCRAVALVALADHGATVLPLHFRTSFVIQPIWWILS